MSWSEHVAEAAFKPVAGGYIFQAPSERPFGPPRFYQVNDGEKAELIAFRRASADRWLRVFKIAWVMIVALIVASVVCFMFVDVIAGVLEISSDDASDRFACEALVAAVSSLVTARIGTGRADELPALRAPLMELARRLSLDRARA